MAENTISKFLKTTEADSKPITCPACGNVMSLKKPSSYRMVLTEKARIRLDLRLQGFASDIRKLENDLKILNVLGPRRLQEGIGRYPHLREIELNSPLKEDGTYSDSQLYHTAIEFTTSKDIFEHREYIFSNKFPLHTGTERRKPASPPPNLFDNILYNNTTSVFDFIVKGFEKASSAGPLPDLVLTQDEILNWMSKYKEDEKKLSDLDSLVRGVVPNIFGYLQDISDGADSLGAPEVAAPQPAAARGGRTVSPAGLAAQEPEPNGNRHRRPTTEEVKHSVRRIKFILALLLGHDHEDARALTLGIIGHGSRFSLPRLTEVKVAILPELLCSDLVVKQCQIDWNQKLLDSINRSSNGDRQEIAELVSTLQDDIGKFLNFTCTGPSGKLAGPTNEEEGDPIPESMLVPHGAENGGEYAPPPSADKVITPIEIQCGWYPKPEHTHPIVLLGSPGTSKSTVMMTGLVTFYNTIGTLGSYIVFNTPEGTEFFKERASNYWRGSFPKATLEGERHSIQLSVVPTDPNQGPELRRQNFVFTDIPGQTVAKLLTKSGADSVLLGILENAETIVIFFDFSIEPSFRQFLLDSQRTSIKDVWKHLLKAFNDVSKGRTEEVVDSESSRKKLLNHAEVDQYHIVAKLIEAIRENKNLSSDDKLGSNCVCVIAKSDLLADFGGEGQELNGHTLFMTEFYKSLYEQMMLTDPTGEVLVNDQDKMPSDFRPLHTQGGIGSLIEKGTKKENPGVSKLQIQREIVSRINDWAVEALSHVDRATTLPGDNNNDLAINGEMLLASVEMRLKQLLYKSFGKENVYFLPVSAAGKREVPSPDDSASRHPQRNETSAESNAPRQKLSEYVFLLPVILAYLNAHHNGG